METSPFNHVIIDDHISLELCRAAVAEWPDCSWPHWLKYDGNQGTKYVTKDASRLTPACTELIRELVRLPIAKLIGVGNTFPDLTLYGAGMAMIPEGGELPLHLDSDHHPITGWRRALNIMLYLRTTDGGELCLWDPDGKVVSKYIHALAGRIVLFECTENAYHSVSKVVSGNRLSLNLFHWKAANWIENKRAKAQFSL